MKEWRGFTLIELLVVIAIIGILSAVVLASLNTARNKGNDAGVKANLNTVVTQSALYLSDNSSGYGTFALGTCPTSGAGTVFHDPTVMKAIAAALADSAGGATGCVSTNTAYAVAVKRPDTTLSTYWCVDSESNRCGVNSFPSGPSCGACASAQ